MAFADSKRLVAEWALAVTEVVRDETLVKAASLKSERKRLAQSITDSADEMLGRPFLINRRCTSSWPC